MLSSEHCFLGQADKVLKAAEKGTEKIFSHISTENEIRKTEDVWLIFCT